MKSTSYAIICNGKIIRNRIIIATIGVISTIPTLGII